MHDGRRKQVFATLRTLIAPGNRVRLSPYVEAAQFSVLFGERPDPKERFEDSRRILEKNAEVVISLADGLADFTKKGKPFEGVAYNPEFLATYLAYYFTTNVCKIQLTLLELAERGDLAGHLSVVDIGVGTGTTCVATLDFLAAWSSACRLHGEELPVESVEFQGVDCNPHALAFARRVTLSYAEAVVERHQDGSSDIRGIDVGAAARESRWEEIDLESTIPEFGPAKQLVFASNILNELSAQGQQNLGKAICSLPEGSIAVVLEPGDKVRTRQLNQWRSDLVRRDGGLNPILPCGEDLGRGQSDACARCWNARREHLHPSLLFKRLRSGAAARAGNREYWDDFENDLLSWSYTVLRREPPRQWATAPLWEIESGAIHGLLRYVGNYRRNDTTACISTEEDNEKPQSNGYRIYDKFCPARADRESFDGLGFDHPVGFASRRMRHGELVRVEMLPVRAERSILRLDAPPDAQDREMFLPISSESGSGADHAGFLEQYDADARSAVDELAYRLFGFDAMRPFQHDILARSLLGQSVLGIASTGGGKSECYILPALLLPGITVVVSPLKSLMQDQYDQRISQRYGLQRLATFINGDVPFREREARLKRMELGYYKIVYFTPEQLERGYVLDSVKRAHEHVGIRYLALDEAHCISQWGHDFRPSYLNLWHRFQERGIMPVRIALTATASPAVRRDLLAELQMSEADLLIHSSNRPELNFAVQVVKTGEERTEEICRLLSATIADNQTAPIPGAAIVFMPWTGGDPDRSAAALNNLDYGHSSPGVTPFAAFLEKRLRRRMAIYHSKIDEEGDSPIEESDDGEEEQAYEKHIARREYGDLSSRTRRGEQEAFISGDRDVMVATKGFGMGIDKPNIRRIIHRCAPSNLEAYVQEAGRAGRDGRAADVILFHSSTAATDRSPFGEETSVPTDYEIQRIFLSGKYVRRIDLLAMRVFLESIRTGDDPRVYFTTDEAIDFLERPENLIVTATWATPYVWPEFPPRQARAKEYGDHRMILERGEAYKNKTRHIERILAVMHGIRPVTASATSRLVFLERYDEVQPILKGIRHLAAAEACSSNHYFGRLFRERNLLPHELKELLEIACGPTGLEPLAKRLDKTLAETARIVSDIQSADGRFFDGRWKPTLLDCGGREVPKRGSAASLRTAEAWLDYAGAAKRASRSEAERRARKAGRARPSLEDWFSEREATKPKGWEVILGPALLDSSGFSEALERFVKEHDEREKNDWDAYRLFLTDYIGVDEDGNPSPKPARNCLRAVMLGYLETFEVVSGDDCRSCSRCRPRGDYEADLRWRREEMVVRLGPTLSDHLRILKEQEASIPSAEETRRFWEEVGREEEVGRSVKPYVLGWSAKLLTETPGHQAALWLRLYGMATEMLVFQTEEFLDHAERLATSAQAASLSQLLDALRMATARQNHSARLLRLLARLEERAGTPERAAKTWRDFLDLVVRTTGSGPGTRLPQAYDASVALARLYSPAGPIPDDNEWDCHERGAARHAPDIETALRHYTKVFASWDATALLEELKLLDQSAQRRVASRLTTAWLAPAPEQRATDLLTLISDSSEAMSWDPQLTMQLLDAIPSTARESFPTVRIWQVRIWLQGVVKAPTEKVTEEALAAIRDGWTPGTEESRLLCELLLEKLAYNTARALIRTSGIARAGLRFLMSSGYRPGNATDLFDWLTLLPWNELDARNPGDFELFETVVDAFGMRNPAPPVVSRERAVATVGNQRLSQPTLKILRDIRAKFAAVAEYRAKLHSLWLRVCRESPEEALRYLTELAKAGDNGAHAMEALLVALTHEWAAETAPVALSEKSSGFLIDALDAHAPPVADDPDLLSLIAQLAHRAERPKRERETWARLLGLLANKSALPERVARMYEHDAHSALAVLHAPTGPLADETLHQLHARKAAQTAPS